MPREVYKGIPAFRPQTKKSWRAWLEKNHAKEKAVWLVLYSKNAGAKTITWEEAVEEALCFGWIDSVINKRDADSRYQYFSPRKERSSWSSKNKNTVARMLKAGKMHESGLRSVALAKKNGTWNAFDEIEKMVIPGDLQKALSANKVAHEHWKKFPPSAVKTILFWVKAAKRPDTRLKRIRETVRLAAKNVRALQNAPKKTSQ